MRDCDINCNVIRSSNITVACGIMTITVQPDQTFVNGREYKLILGTDLPAHTGTEPVQILCNEVKIPCWYGNICDVTGNILVSGSLRGSIPIFDTCGRCCGERARMYRLQFGSNPTHFSFLGKLFPLQFSAMATLDTEGGSVVNPIT